MISYGVYIYHLPVFRVVEDFSIRHGLGDRLDLDLVKLALSVLTAALSWKFIEQPILSLKKRFAYARGPRVQRQEVPSPGVRSTFWGVLQGIQHADHDRVARDRAGG